MLLPWELQIWHSCIIVVQYQSKPRTRSALLKARRLVRLRDSGSCASDAPVPTWCSMKTLTWNHANIRKTCGRSHACSTATHISRFGKYLANNRSGIKPKLVQPLHILFCFEFQRQSETADKLQGEWTESSSNSSNPTTSFKENKKKVPPTAPILRQASRTMRPKIHQ
jgi:hypothetical protein